MGKNIGGKTLEEYHSALTQWSCRKLESTLLFTYRHKEYGKSPEIKKNLKVLL
jgi:ferric iron reductase protein FhuF